jgi:hypothetical protein
MNPLDFVKMGQNLQTSMSESIKGLKCIWEEMKLIRRFNELEFGRLRSEAETEIRDADQLQYVFEEAVTAEKTVDLREKLGYNGRDGFIANLGSDAFQVVLIGKREGNQTTKFTIPPSTSYAIKSPVSKVIIYPTTATAFPQISIQ